ncbi:hypothetical protein [Streptomyces sp. AC495_CC817]|uniref:hypothetical protein n=1 Tax=Streptomyces sp. AC495_CC817 TaxID=2823900 RepID=UPI001C2649F6|nr:hypothetical protein [Streptomyces sp. AC495_CC817]
MEGLIILGLCLYVALILGLAASKGNVKILWWLFLPALPLLLFLALIAGIVALFGGAATAAIKQETGIGADGSRAYPYWVRRD